MATIRDLLLRSTKPSISTPARSVDATLTVEDAARLMAESGQHHLVVVGGDGRVVGLVSSYDLMRALVGMPPHFPPTFPHRDSALDVTWTDVTPFDIDHLGGLPEEAGVLVLSTGGAQRREADLTWRDRWFARVC